jgi:hypothetical protein
MASGVFVEFSRYIIFGQSICHIQFRSFDSETAKRETVWLEFHLNITQAKSTKWYAHIPDLRARLSSAPYQS